MAYSDDDHEIGHREWVRSLHESRQMVREALAEVELAGIEHDAVHVESDEERQLATRLHALVLDYRDHVAPFADRAGEAWTATLYETERYHISLKSLSEWRLQTAAIERVSDDHVSGGEQVTEHVQLHLPPIAAAEANEQLNGIVEDLGWAAEVDDQEDARELDPI